MTPDLTDTDRADLARFLRDAIDADRYPFSPKALLAKVDPTPEGAAGADGQAGWSRAPHAGGSTVSCAQPTGRGSLCFGKSPVKLLRRCQHFSSITDPTLCMEAVECPCAPVKR